MARPTKYNRAVAERIAHAIEQGATYELAAAHGGVSYETLRVWREAKPAFSVLLEAAEAKAAMRWLTWINAAAADGDWRAAAFMLERRYPQHYGRRALENHISGELTIAYVNDWRPDRILDIAITRREQQEEGEVEAWQNQ